MGFSKLLQKVFKDSVLQWDKSIYEVKHVSIL